VLGAGVIYPSNNVWLGKTVIGDLNGDGREDVVVQEVNGVTGVLIYYQQPNGFLAPPVTFATPDLDVLSIAVGDLNGDGKDDLVLGGNSLTGPGYGAQMSVYYQDPASGTLLPTVVEAVSSTGVYDVAIGDLDHDGDNDLVASAVWMVATTGRLSIRYQGPGGLGPEVLYDSILVDPGEMHIADVTGDGRKDIVLQSGQLELGVVPQTSTGGLSLTPAHYAVQTSYWPRFDGLAVGDLNGDGRNDVVTEDPGNSGYLNFFVQNAGGTLNRSLSAPQASQFFGLEVADLNRDGLADIIGDASGTVGVYYQAPRSHLPGGDVLLLPGSELRR
jgi:hypothetical protein